MKAGRCFGQAVAVLAVFAVARSFGLLGPAVISVSLLTAALVLIAWSAGATSADPSRTPRKANSSGIAVSSTIGTPISYSSRPPPICARES